MHSRILVTWSLHGMKLLTSVTPSQLFHSQSKSTQCHCLPSLLDHYREGQGIVSVFFVFLHHNKEEECFLLKILERATARCFVYCSPHDPSNMAVPARDYHFLSTVCISACSTFSLTIAPAPVAIYESIGRSYPSTNHGSCSSCSVDPLHPLHPGDSDRCRRSGYRFWHMLRPWEEQ